jgi:hypothetical protein
MRRCSRPPCPSTHNLRRLRTAAIPERTGEGEPRRITATVVVSQVHTFRLSDMLRAYVGMGPEENRQLAKQAIVQAVHDTCNRMADLSALKVLKLSMTCDSVVFCPELREADEEWEVLGYTFRAAGFDPIAGKPHLIDYDHRLCKRLGTVDGYDKHCSYLMMMTLFLASVRAQFHAAYPMVYEAVQTFGHWKEARAAAPDKLESFREMFRRTFLHSKVERDPIPKSTLERAIDDFSNLVASPSPDPGSAYHGLLLWLLGSRSYTPATIMSEEAVAAERNQHRKDMALLDSVIDARKARLLARKK